MGGGFGWFGRSEERAVGGEECEKNEGGTYGDVNCSIAYMA